MLKIYAGTVLTVDESIKVRGRAMRCAVYEEISTQPSFGAAMAWIESVRAAGANAYSLPTIARVTIVPTDDQIIDSAAQIARTVLARAESRQPFFRVARKTVDAVRAVCRDSERCVGIADVGNMHDVAQDLIGIASMALAGNYSEYECPVFQARAEAYDAVNAYIDARRAADEREAYRELLADVRGVAGGYGKYDEDDGWMWVEYDGDDRLDRRMDSDYNGAYSAGANERAVNMLWDDDRRREYVAHRRENIEKVREAFAVMTPRQRFCFAEYAEGKTLREIAAEMGLKDTSGAGPHRHMLAGRRAVGVNGLDDLCTGVTPFENVWCDAEHWTVAEADAIAEYRRLRVALNTAAPEWTTGTQAGTEAALRAARARNEWRADEYKPSPVGKYGGTPWVNASRAAAEAAERDRAAAEAAERDQREKMAAEAAAWQIAIIEQDVAERLQERPGDVELVNMQRKGMDAITLRRLYYAQRRLEHDRLLKLYANDRKRARRELCRWLFGLRPYPEECGPAPVPAE